MKKADLRTWRDLRKLCQAHPRTAQNHTALVSRTDPAEWVPRTLVAGSVTIPGTRRSRGRDRCLEVIVRLSRALLLLMLALLALPVSACKKGDECSKCSQDSDCSAGLLCTNFSDNV